MGTFTNSEDTDKMSHYDALIVKEKQIYRQKNTFLKIIT